MVSCSQPAGGPVSGSPRSPILSWIFSSFLASAGGTTGEMGVGHRYSVQATQRGPESGGCCDGCNEVFTGVSQEYTLRAGGNSCQFTSMAGVPPVGFGEEWV